MFDLPATFRLAKIAAEESKMNPKMGAVLVLDKQTVKGYNKDKTHPKYANPEIHVRKSLHAELDCLVNAPSLERGELYVYRELEGKPAMARPCNHCMKFIKEAGIDKVHYTIPHSPYWETEEIR